MARRQLTPSLKAEIALMRFGPLSRGEPSPSYDAIIRDLKEDGHIDLTDIERSAAHKVIQRAIGDAFANGYVRIERQSIVAHYAYDEPLSRSLQERFGIKRAIVIRIEGLNKTASKIPAPKQRVHQNNIAHEQLGHALARHITANAELFRDGDRIAIGNGRGVHYTVMSLQEMPRCGANNINILSYSGSLSRYKKEDGASLSVWDADDNALLLMRAFSGSVVAQQINHHIVCHERQRGAVLRNTPLGLKRRGNQVPLQHAIMGLGVMDHDHYFFKDIRRREDDKRGMALDEESMGPNYEFFGLLSRLVRKLDQVHDAHPGYWAAAEISGRYFFVEPPKGVNFIELDDTPKTDVEAMKKAGKPVERKTRRISIEKLRQEFNEIIRNLNLWLLNPTFDQLSEIQNVMLAAGTPAKALAIRTLLLHCSGHETSPDNGEHLPPIRCLCVDDTTALAILEACR